MSEPVTFMVIRPTEVVEARLGSHLVAVIEPWPNALRDPKPMLGTVRAYYHLTLEPDGRCYPASSMISARRQVLHRLAGWFDDAGPLFSVAALTLLAQAEQEREAA